MVMQVEVQMSLLQFATITDNLYSDYLCKVSICTISQKIHGERTLEWKVIVEVGFTECIVRCAEVKMLNKGETFIVGDLLCSQSWMQLHAGAAVRHTEHEK